MSLFWYVLLYEYFVTIWEYGGFRLTQFFKNNEMLI